MRLTFTLPDALPATRAASAAALLVLAFLSEGGLAAQAAPSSSSVEARLRALEARVAALEGRGAESSAPAGAAAAVMCRRLSVSGSAIVAGSTLTVTVNGTVVGTFDGNASGDLENQMQPGLNVVRLSFAAAGTSGPFGTQADLRCLPPGTSNSRSGILRLQPSPGRLSAEARVNLVRP